MGENTGLVRQAVRLAWRDFRASWRPLLVFDILFKLAAAWLLVPIAALALARILDRAGHVAISNQDILDFLLSPAGLFYAALYGSLRVALLLLEQAGIMSIAALAERPQRPSLLRMLAAAGRRMLAIGCLGAFKLALLALTFLPFLLLSFLVYSVLLTQHDLYFYLKDRPPAFWAAGVLIGLVLLAGSIVGLVLFVRWSFALPILLFERTTARAALRTSRERVRGAAWRVGAALVAWQMLGLAAHLTFDAGFRAAAAPLLDSAGRRPLALILLLLVCQGLGAAVLSFLTVVGHGLLTRRLCLVRSGQLGVPLENEIQAESTPTAVSPWARRLTWLGFVIVLVGPLAIWADLPRQVADRPPVKVTAHRGHARAAPENTLAALRKAIESGADYAEIDVHQTADGVVVLLHDRDLKRVAGLSRRLDELSFAEASQLDVGSWFSPAFAAERVPTLAEAIRLCRGRMKLNIELKFFGPDRSLAKAVAKALRDEAFEAECIVTSLHYDGLVEFKKHYPAVRRGLIVAHALGSIGQLDLDLLSVRAEHLTDAMVRDARRQGREVHAWTVNDEARMIDLIERDVDNILTSDPDLLVRVRREFGGLTGTERLLLASRLRLGLGP